MSNRVLIVKLAALGDAIMASTLVPAIRSRWSDARVTWVTGRAIAPVMRLMEGIDEVIEVNDRALLGGNKAAAVLAMAAAWRNIGRGYELALVAHTDARYERLTWASGAAQRHRFANERGPRAGHWHGNEYRRLLDGDVHEGSAAPFPRLRTGMLRAAPVIPGSGALVLVAAGGGRNVLRDDPLRRWPIESWTAVVRDLARNGHRVVAIGGADDAREGAACAAAGAVDLTGRTTLLELMALIQEADVVVTHDAGPLHLALLLDRPTVALFGPTPPAERVPAGARITVLTRAADLPCAPCYNGLTYAACALNLCLARVAPAEVLLAIRERLTHLAAARTQ